MSNLSDSFWGGFEKQARGTWLGSAGQKLRGFFTRQNSKVQNAMEGAGKAVSADMAKNPISPTHLKMRKAIGYGTLGLVGAGAGANYLTRDPDAHMSSQYQRPQ